MKYDPITAVGIDVSKGKSTITVRRPGGEVVLAPFNVKHNQQELKGLVKSLRKIGGNVRIVMEHTGMYWRPIACTLKDAGFYVSVVNAILIHNFRDNTIRKVKTDKADARKIANYALAYWEDLREYTSEDETRLLLKMHTRQYDRILTASGAMKNGLIAQLDLTFPNVNKLLETGYRNTRGHTKWVDFVRKYWHKDCVTRMSITGFTESYHKWCIREGYHFHAKDAEEIYQAAQTAVATLPACPSTKRLIVQAVDGLNAVYETLQHIREEMMRLSSLLPEFAVVMAMPGAGESTGPRLMAEIGDVRRFKNKRSLVAYAGMDAPPFQSGDFDAKSRHISKRGSPHLRKALFQVSNIILKNSNPNNPVFQFMDKKRAEGKHYYVYTTAGAAKFLRIYYARVMEYLTALDGAGSVVA